MKDIKVIWKDKTHKISITSYKNVHSFGIIKEDGKTYIRIYIEDVFGGETATYEFNEILSIEL
ncbi:MAG: hypothetical protein KH054_12045 [Firmicutes bacterium]|nr:hypothetical protein [Bacillota bacterium]